MQKNFFYQNWAVYHKDLTDSSHYYAVLSHNYAEITGSNPSLWNNLDPTPTEFSLDNNIPLSNRQYFSFVNQSDNSTSPTYYGQFIAYLFATLSGIILGSFVPEELGLKFAIPLTFIAIVVQDLKKIDHLIVMITCGLSSLLFFDAPFKSYIIISPLIALFVAALLLRLKKWH